MFRCQACGGTAFALLLQPGQSQQAVRAFCNAHHELLIQVGQRAPFVADLPFMNRFAHCSHCNSRHQWQYWFPPANAAPDDPLSEPAPQQHP